MISEFHGDDKETHEAYQLWRRNSVDGFNMTESSRGLFTIHWAQDKRENRLGRGCIHQGGSGNEYRAGKNCCYTSARKICSDSLDDLIAWAKKQNVKTKNCLHCDTKKFPFPVTFGG